MTTPMEQIRQIKKAERVQQVRYEIETELMLLDKSTPTLTREHRIAYVPRSQLENWLRLLGGEPKKP